MNKLLFVFMWVCGLVGGIAVCNAAQQAYVRPLTDLLGTEIAYISAKNISTVIGLSFKIDIIQSPDGSYNIRFHDLPKELLEQSIIGADKILDHLRGPQARTLPNCDGKPVIYVGSVRCAQDKIFVKNSEQKPPRITTTDREASAAHREVFVHRSHFCSPTSALALLGAFVVQIVSAAASCPSPVFDECQDF